MVTLGKTARKRPNTVFQSNRRFYSEHPKSLQDGKGPVFLDCIVAPTVPGVYYVKAQAIVDQDWAQHGNGADAPHPDIPPQSHVVNGRTNPSWRMENAGYVVQGQLNWESDVIELTIEGDGVPPEAQVPSVPSTTIENPAPTSTPTPSASSTLTPSPSPSRTLAPVSTSTAPMPSEHTDSNKKANNQETTPLQELPHFASALGYIVVGIGGIVVGAIGTILWLRIFSDPELVHSGDEQESDQLLRNVVDDADEDPEEEEII